MPEDRTRGRTAVCCALLVLATAAVYWPVLRHGFINLDDSDYVSGNPPVTAGLTWQGVKWAFTSTHAGNWHPATWLSHMLDCQLYHLRPAGHHLTNLLLHTANVLLLFGLLKRLTGALWRSALVAALFALHPLHVESVAWVAERKDVLSGFFFLLTLWAYVQYVKAKGLRLKAEGGVSSQWSVASGSGAAATGNDGPRTTDHGLLTKHQASRFTFHVSTFYLLSLTFFALGLMSKPMLVTLPFVLLLLDYWPLRRLQLSTLNSQLSTVFEKLPFFALSAVSCVVTFVVQQASGATQAPPPLDARLANALVACARYLGKTLWPANLAVFYPYTPFDLGSWQVVGAGLLLAAVTASLLAYALKEGRRMNDQSRKGLPSASSLQSLACPLAMGWLWFVGMLVPAIGLVQVGLQAMADRYTYLPHIGLFIAVTWGAVAAAERRRGRASAPASPEPTEARRSLGSRGRSPSLALACGLAVLVLTACGLLTARQVSYWQNNTMLFGHAAAVTSGNYRAYAIIGSQLGGEGRLTEGIEWCRKSLDIAPGYAEAHNTLGAIYARQGKNDEALAEYETAAQEDPAYLDAREALANLLLRQRRFAEAEGWCREALRLAPQKLPVMYSLATALHQQGKLDEAAGWYRRILAVDPALSTPHRFLGNILAAQGKPEAAIAEWRLALKVRPADGDTRTVLGVVLLEQGQLDEAAAQLSEAARLQATNALANSQLALIHEQRHETRAAIECFRRALQAQPDWPETLNNLAWILAANPEASLRNGTEAVQLAERACKLTGYKEPLMVGTLAAAYAEAGRFEDAVKTAEKARDLAAAAGLKAVAEKNSQLLELYRAAKPYRDGAAGSR
jgi:protein O-mannosyl-transferase